LADAVGFTGLLGLVVAVASTALLAVLPVRRSHTQEVRLVKPQSGAYQEVVLRTEAAAWGSGAPEPPVEIELVPNPAGATQPTSLSTQPAAAPGLPPRLTVRTDSFGPAAVLDWMKAAGVNTAQPGIPEEATRIAGEARIVARRRRREIGAGSGVGDVSMGFRPGGYTSRSSGSDYSGQFASRFTDEQARQDQPGAAVILFFLFFFALWVAGLRHLASRVVPAPPRRRPAG
jgi:hypothetical protein